MMQTLNEFVGADMGDVDRYVLKQGSTMVGGVSRTVPKTASGLIPLNRLKSRGVLEKTILDIHTWRRPCKAVHQRELQTEQRIRK